jgi:hypothetical protein
MCTTLALINIDTTTKQEAYIYIYSRVFPTRVNVALGTAVY